MLISFQVDGPQTPVILSGSVIICTDPDPDLDPHPDLSIIKQKSKKNLGFRFFVICFYL
jgi:hypothetical protein